MQVVEVVEEALVDETTDEDDMDEMVQIEQQQQMV